MGHIYCMMGKSASGKDTIYNCLVNDTEADLKRIIPYTTRPIRSGEMDGEAYHFTDIDGFKALENTGKVIESRCYHTYHGDWYYFTVDDDSINTTENDYLMIGTLESYVKVRDYYGKDTVVPIYIDLDDGIRLERALKREQSQANPKYQEMCRRFLADAEDFSDEKLVSAGIENADKYINDDKDALVKRILEKIWTLRSTRS